MFHSIIFVLSLGLLANASNLPFSGNFGDTPQPFKIDVRILLKIGSYSNNP
jgi:hypothetical protein